MDVKIALKLKCCWLVALAASLKPNLRPTSAQNLPDIPTAMTLPSCSLQVRLPSQLFLSCLYLLQTRFSRGIRSLVSSSAGTPFHRKPLQNFSRASTSRRLEGNVSHYPASSLLRYRTPFTPSPAVLRTHNSPSWSGHPPPHDYISSSSVLIHQPPEIPDLRSGYDS